MSDDRWRLHVYNRAGDLFNVSQGTEADLREEGVGLTTQRGQLSWVCALFKNGVRVAECRRGTWREVQS